MTERTQNTTLHTRLSRIARRLWLLHGARAACVCVGVFAGVLLLASRFSDPVLTSQSAQATWVAALVLAAMAGWLVLRPARAYRGVGIASAFTTVDERVASRLRTALELETSDVSHVSPELLAAHRADVERTMAEIPEARVAPVSILKHASVLIGVCVVVLAATAALVDSRTRAFMSALIDPAHVRDDGTRVTRVASRTRVRAVYPSYLARETEEWTDPRSVRVPRGTKLEVRIDTAFEAARGLLIGGSRSTKLVRDAEGKLSGTWAAETNAELRLRVERDGVKYEDPRAIALHVQVDEKPSLEVREPKNGSFVPPDAVLPVVVQARDDVGVVAIDLYVRLPDGSVHHERMWSGLDAGGPHAEVEAAVAIVPRDLGGREGDVLTLWASARDEDPSSGSNVTSSPEISIEITSQTRQMAAFIPDMQEIADGSVELLGDRLEHEVPDDSARAGARFQSLEDSTRAWLERIDALLTANTAEFGTSALNKDQLRGIKRRNLKLLTQERALHQGVTAGQRERQRVDAQAVAELERDVLLLADLLAKAHMEEASAIAEELRELKKRIEALIAQVGKAQSPEDERKILAEIARAQQRLAQLSRSLSKMSTRVPSEFVNHEALLRKQEAQSTLDDLRQAVENHDLESAAAHLDALAKQIDDLAAQLGDGELRLQQQRFGPRDKAMADARQKLDMLAAEQDRLAGRSAQATGQGGQGSGSGSSSERDQLARQVEDIERTLDAMERGGSPFEGQRLERARERLSDTKAALQSGDMAQARDMARSAQRGLSDAASDLSAEASMFPGHRGETRRNAELARKAADQTGQLSDAISERLAREGSPRGPADRQRMQQDAQAQRAAREQANKLKDAFENGPGGTPLSPDAVEQLEQAGKAMQAAERALEQGSANDAARAQREASESLADLSKKLAQQGEKGSRGNESGGGSGDGNTQGDVKIPGADDWRSPTQMRRKLLDAMRESAPKGFEAAVERYYQELLR